MRSPRPRVNSSLSACTATGSSRRAASRRPSSRVTSSTRGNSGRPESHMNALNPTTPRAAISAMSDTEPGTSPPHSAKSVIDEASSAARLRSNSRAFTVHGVEFSGMSKNSVPPPAASARLPVAAPSHSVRPGSLKCRCTSMTPGNTRSPSASISSRPPGASTDTSLIAPSSIARSARCSPLGVTSVPPTDHDVAHARAPRQVVEERQSRLRARRRRHPR